MKTEADRRPTRLTDRLSALALAMSAVLSAAGCGSLPAGDRRQEGSMLDSILAGRPATKTVRRLGAGTGEAWERVLADPEGHRLQVVLGRLEPAAPDTEQAGGRPVLVQQGYRADTEYFYPASTVKLFAAVAALERLAELRRETGLPIDADTPLVYHPQFEGEGVIDTDPSDVERGVVTVRHEIRKLFLVSDNEAYNRLYELVGQDGLARSLAAAGLGDARIVHRLSERRSAEENRAYPRIDFAGDGFVYSLPERTSEPLPAPPPVAGLAVGRGYLDGGRRVDGPMDFTPKNRITLADLQRGLCMVVAPEADCGGPGFALSEADRELLLDAMSRYPADSANPVYDRARYPDHYVKFFLPGLARVIPQEDLAVYDKSGCAYGFATDNAWIVDRRSGRSFFLAATLYANDNGVLNDDRYEYGSVSFPFLARLAEAVAGARLLRGEG